MSDLCVRSRQVAENGMVGPVKPGGLQRHCQVSTQVCPDVFTQHHFVLLDGRIIVAFLECAVSLLLGSIGDFFSPVRIGHESQCVTLNKAVKGEDCHCSWDMASSSSEELIVSGLFKICY